MRCRLAPKFLSNWPACRARLDVKTLALEDWPTGHWRTDQRGPWEAIGHRLRDLRNYRRLNSRHAGECAGISAQAWCKWERGLTKLGSRQLLIAARVLGVRVFDIVQAPGHRDIILDRESTPCCCSNCNKAWWSEFSTK